MKCFRKDYTPKNIYISLYDAKIIAHIINIQNDTIDEVNPYFCKSCNGYHIGRNGKNINKSYKNKLKLNYESNEVFRYLPDGYYDKKGVKKFLYGKIGIIIKNSKYINNIIYFYDYYINFYKNAKICISKNDTSYDLILYDFDASYKKINGKTITL